MHEKGISMALTKKRQGTERDRLADEIAELTAQIKALRAERKATIQVTDLEREVERLKLEKDRLTEDNDRKIRETEHKTGLLRKQVEAEQKQAAEQAKLAAERAKIEVREENLGADKQRFADEVKFQREHMQREMDRFDGIVKELMTRLPVIDVSLGGSVGQTAAPKKAAGRRAPAGKAAEE